MKIFKKIKNSILALLILLLLTIIYTMFLYFKILKTDNISFKIITFLFSFMTFFVISYIVTSKSNKKGWLKGLTIGVLLLTIPIFYNIKNYISFNYALILKFSSLLSSSMLAGIINVNKNKEK